MGSDKDYCVNYDDGGYTGIWCPDVGPDAAVPATVPASVEGGMVGSATYYTSYAACCPDNPNYDSSADTKECDWYSACDYPGIFAAFDIQMSYDWVETHNIIAFFDAANPSYEQFTSMYAGKIIRLTKGGVTLDAIIADTCGDHDCGNR